MDKNTTLRLESLAPDTLMVEPTNNCNLSCAMCPREQWSRPTGYMSDETFDRIMRSAEEIGLPHVNLFTCTGEPLLHPKILHMASRVKQSNMGLTISTNGNLLTDQLINGLLDTGIDMIQFSFCGHDKASYETIYRGGVFDTVVNNILTISNTILQHNLRTRLLINGTLTTESATLKEKCTNFLKSLGIKHSDIQINLACNMAGRVSFGKYQNSIRARSLRTTSQDAFRLCDRLISHIGIFHDGTVTACGCRDINGDMAVGNIHGNSILECMQSAQYIEIIKSFLSNRIDNLSMCSKCDMPFSVGS